MSTASPEQNPHRSRTPALIARAREGDQDAWSELYDLFAGMIQRSVRRRISPLRNQLDSCDLANDVWKSFVANIEYCDFQNAEDVQAYVLKLAHDKVQDQLRRSHALKRDINRNRSISELGPDGHDLEVLGDDPTPSAYVQADETRERLMGELGEHERRVIELKMLGHTTHEVAELTGIHLRSIQRILQRANDRYRLGY
jgi:RNA polymerase sigma factor (sigma-70 family)